MHMRINNPIGPIVWIVFLLPTICHRSNRVEVREYLSYPQATLWKSLYVRTSICTHSGSIRNRSSDYEGPFKDVLCPIYGLQIRHELATTTSTYVRTDMLLKINDRAHEIREVFPLLANQLVQRGEVSWLTDCDSGKKKAWKTRKREISLVDCDCCDFKRRREWSTYKQVRGG